MKSSRLYRVARAGADNADLVRATNKEQALRHIARTTFAVSLATDQDIYDAGIRSVQIQDAFQSAPARMSGRYTC